MIMPRSEKRKYDLRYYAEWFSLDMPSRRARLHSRTLDGAKREAEIRFPPHVPGDTIRIRGVVRAGTRPENSAVVVSENVFPRTDWMDSDEAQWFQMVEGEAELADGFAPPDEEAPVPHAKIKYIAETLGIQPYRVAALLRDYGDVIAGTSGIGLMTIADAARYLNVKKCRVDQLRMKGRLGAVVCFSGRRFLRRGSVKAFAEKLRRDIAEVWERIRRIEAEEQRRRSS